MDRSEKALQHIRRDGRGLEIGPSYNPLVTKASGANVEIVDHADQATLVAKYRGYGLDEELVGRIEAVDHQWPGGSLLDLIPEHGAYDYVVASHFIEHTVDLIGFLQDCEALLVDGGTLALVVPDKRYCFDRYQPLTTVGDVVDAHHAKQAFHTAGSLLDHQAYACKRNEADIAWGVGAEGPLGLQFPALEGGTTVIEDGLRQDSYHDIHRWKFTPTSFHLLVDDLRVLGFHSMVVAGSDDTDGFEFYCSLRTGGATTTAPAFDRTAALATIEREVAAPLIGTTSAAEAPASADEVRALKARIAAMEASHSWRITRPVRAATDALRALKARRG